MNPRKPPRRASLLLILLVVVASAAALLSIGGYSNEAAAQSPIVPIVRSTPQLPLPQQQRPTIEVAFVLDTTGSMSGLLEGAKQKIWSIASRIAAGQPSPQLRVGLVGYRDVGDEYVTRSFDLNDNLDTVYANLRSFQAGGGGDWPEHVGRGLGEAVRDFGWSQDGKVLRMIFVVGDAPPSAREQEWDYRAWAKIAKQKQIQVHTVRCGGAHDTELAWSEISTLADGSFSSIDAQGGMIAVATPYDKKLAEVNAQLAMTTLYGGHAKARDEARRSADKVAEMGASAAADRMAFSSAKAKRAGISLGAAAAPAAEGVIDLLAKPAAAAKLRKDELPPELSDLAPEKRAAVVAKRAAARTKLEQQAQKLSQERDAWLSKNAAEKTDAFDTKVMDVIRKDAKKIGVAY